MKAFFVFLMLLTTACSQSFRSPANGEHGLSTGIIGGSDVPPGYPLARSVVGILVPTSTPPNPRSAIPGFLCTGTLLANNIVVTAAHCVTSDPSKIRVYFGNTISPQTKFLMLDGVAISDQWPSRQNTSPDSGDIAVIHLRGTIPPGYAPATILPPNLEAMIRPNDLFMTMGYGVNNGVTKTGQGVLRIVPAKVFNPRFGKTELLLDQTQGKGTCHGDSGGPVFASLNNQIYLWGVISRGENDPKDECSQMAVSTKASVHKAWIEEQADILVRRANGGRNNPFSGL